MKLNLLSAIHLRITLAALAFLFIHSFSQASAQNLIQQQADSLLAAGQFEQVELLVLRINGHADDLMEAELANLQLTAGFAMIMLDREDDARRYFVAALDYNPSLTLDPVTVSPKFRIVFDEIKAQYLKESREKPLAAFRGAQSASHVLNLLLPGAGQIREGQLAKGVVLMAAQAAALGVFLHSLNITADSRDRYLAQTDPDQIRETYHEYDDDHRASWGYGILSGTVYIFAQADLALFKTRITQGERETADWRLTPTSRGVRFSVSW